MIYIIYDVIHYLCSTRDGIPFPSLSSTVQIRTLHVDQYRLKNREKNPSFQKYPDIRVYRA